MSCVPYEKTDATVQKRVDWQSARYGRPERLVRHLPVANLSRGLLVLRENAADISLCSVPRIFTQNPDVFRSTG